MIFIEIEIKEHSFVKEIFRKAQNRLENLLFSIIQRLPDSMIPSFMIDWLDRYLTKRLNQLKQDNIKLTWHNMYLEEALKEILNR